MIWPFKPKPPKLPWLYLGWREIKYKYNDGEIAQTIQFYARGDDLKERKVEYIDQTKGDRWQRHPFFQQAVIPWIGGNNLWGPINHPSEALKDWTKEHSGHEWKGEHWYKPAKQITENVVEFPRKERNNRI